VRISRHTV